DGIRDKLVTGVQTCALPISYQQALEERLGYLNGSEAAFGLAPLLIEALDKGNNTVRRRAAGALGQLGLASAEVISALLKALHSRSEERRVGKEGRSWRAR